MRYLEAGNYAGVEISQALLDAGYDVELASAGLQDRLPRHHLVRSDTFDVAHLHMQFDFLLAASVFTHVTLNTIRQCLERMACVTKPGARFYATFFELPDDAKATLPYRHKPSDVVTHGAEDPYHYFFRDFQHLVNGLPWSVHYIGEWGHPKRQRMLLFLRQFDPGEPWSLNDKEWRQPATVPEGFDGDAYLAANLDVAAAGMDPAEHYLRSGWREGRRPQ